MFKKTFDKIKKTKLLTKIFILWSIIEIILIISSAFSDYNSGTLFASFSLLAPFVLIPLRLLVVWGLYFIIKLIKYLSKKKKVYTIVFLSVSILLLAYKPIFQKFNLKTYQISDIIDFNYGTIINNNNFLINNDKLYYLVYENRNDSIMDLIFLRTKLNKLITPENLQYSINSMNLDETDNQILCNNLKEEFSGDFLFIKDNELYYSHLGNGFNKTNLNDCKSTNLVDGGYKWLKNTLKDNYIYMYYQPSTYNEEVSFIKYDLSKNKIVERKKIINRSNQFVIDYNNFNIYNVGYYDSNEGSSQVKSVLYKNDEIIYEPLIEGSMELLLLQDDYLLLYNKDKIYQYNLNTNSVVNTISNKFENISTIFSDTNDNYLLANNRIYKYDAEKMNSWMC